MGRWLSQLLKSWRKQLTSGWWGLNRWELWVFLLFIGLLLFPVIAGRLAGARWSFAGAVRFRRERHFAGTQHPADLVWLFVTVLAGLWTLSVFGVLLRRVGTFASSERRAIRDAVGHGVHWWTISGILTTTVGSLLLSVMAIAIPWTFMKGAWRRTRWGWRPGIESEPLDDQPDSRLTPRQGRTLALMTVTMVLVGVAIVGAGLYQWWQAS